MLTLKNKVVVHIPHKAWEDGKFVEINYVQAREDLIQKLTNSGVGGFYVVECTGYYKNRSYKEDLLTFFYNRKNNEQENIIKNWIEQNKTILKQECFAVEIDGKLFIQ